MITIVCRTTEEVEEAVPKIHWNWIDPIHPFEGKPTVLGTIKILHSARFVACVQVVLGGRLYRVISTIPRTHFVYSSVMYSWRNAMSTIKEKALRAVEKKEDFLAFSNNGGKGICPW